MNGTPLKLLVCGLSWFLGATLLHADSIEQVSSGEARGLVGVVGNEPALDYLGVVTQNSPVTINSNPEQVVESLHAITPNVGDVIGRDLLGPGSLLFNNPWSYQIDLPADGDIGLGLFDIVFSGEAHFNNTNFEFTDFLLFQLFVNGQTAASATALVQGIDGGGFENVNLTPVNNLPGTISTVEVRVRAGLFAQDDESFLLHNVNLSANYLRLTPIPEPGFALLALAMGLALTARRRRIG